MTKVQQESPLNNFDFSRNQIDIWQVNLEQSADSYREMYEILSIDEKKRADQFIFEKDSLHFTLARGFLRCIIGKYTRISPGMLKFKYSQNGKPYLVNRPGFTI